MKEKFTKGPWQVEDGAYPSFVNVECGVMMTIPICFSATDLSYSDGQERVANAHLIAAAPDMYELLDEMASYDECQRFKKQINDLLAKARGE